MHFSSSKCKSGVLMITHLKKWILKRSQLLVNSIKTRPRASDHVSAQHTLYYYIIICMHYSARPAPVSTVQ